MGSYPIACPCDSDDGIFLTAGSVTNCRYLKPGPHMINAIFDACVWLLLQLAAMFGTTYKAINVWIFCFVGPLVFAAVVGFALLQYQQIKKLKQQLNCR